MPYMQFGAHEIEVDITSPRGGYERIGPVYRTYAGGLRSQVRAIKRTYEGSTPPLTFDQAEALLTAVGMGMVTVSGVWSIVARTADVEITSDVPIKDERELDTDSLRIISFRVRESAPV